MEAIDEIVLMGLSQRTAPVAVRERYAVAADDASGLLAQLTAAPSVDEAAIISTCNRTEILLAGSDAGAASGLIRSTLLRNADEAHVYEFRGVQAIIHLFRVASGLDSLVLGESEILGQIKRSYDLARDLGTAGKFLDPLLAQALVVGKRARSETSIGGGTLSVARVGLDVASRALGRLDRRRATVIGAGETGMLVARHLLDGGVGHLCLCNRTVERAEAAASELGSKVEALGLDAMGKSLVEADLGVVCVDGTEPLVTLDCLDARRLARRDQPLVLLDLSVPRGIDPAISQLDDVLVYDLDALLPIVEENKQGRTAATEEVAAILIGEVHKYLSLRTYAAFTPAIHELKVRFDTERERVIDSVTNGQATPRELELAHAMEKQFLGLALSQLKESARHTRSEAALDRAYRRFLDELRKP